jgi:glycosyltransferase involved in cell wall biosynthesis
LRLAAKPYVLTLHGGDLPGFARRWPGRVRRLLVSAAVVTTPSRYLREEMQGYRQDMLLLLPNPLNLKAYQFQLREHPRPRLIWLRAFHEVYNPVLALEVLAILASKVPDIHLIMVGPDKGDGSLSKTRRSARELGLEERISFTGQVSKQDVPLWLNKGDIFLNTTNVDNTPVSVLEAMACGLCVVSTEVGGIPYLLENGRDALLVPPGDPEAMAAAVDRILQQPTLAGSLSLRARRKVEQFDWGIILPQWEELLIATAKRAIP